MTFGFVFLTALILAGAVAAMSLRNLVHCALAFTLTFAGLAGIYLQLNAQFVGFAQVLIYIGAVAILMVFAILLTGRTNVDKSLFSSSWWFGVAVAATVFGTLSGGVMASNA